MSAPLITAEFMAEMVALDESAMNSTAVVYHRRRGQNERGGSGLGPWTPRHSTPIACRVQYGGTARQESLVGDRLQSISDVTIALAFSGIRTQDVTVDSDDEIEVTTPFRNGDGSTTQVRERYKVVGDPGPGSYSTNLSVAAVKVT